jgi:hypothetical protein
MSRRSLNLIFHIFPERDRSAHIAAVFGARMNMTLHDEPIPLSHALDQVISQHGRLRVVGALLLRLLQHPAQMPVARIPLNAHLRRDIGLPPHPPDPPM